MTIGFAGYLSLMSRLFTPIFETLCYIISQETESKLSLLEFEKAEPNFSIPQSTSTQPRGHSK